MSELQVIQGALEGAGRRRRWSHALRGLWLGLLAGALLWLVVLALFKLVPIPEAILVWTACVAALCPLAGLVLGGWHRPALTTVARWVDLRQNLKERLSTALEVAGKDESGTWRELVLADAAGHVKEINPRQLVRFSLPKSARWTALILVLAAGLGFVPEYRTKAYLQRQADQKNIREVGRQLADLTRRSLVQRPPAMEPTQKAMESVADLGDQLKKASLTRSEALKDLANAADKLKDQLSELGTKEPALNRMEQAARQAGGSDSQSAAALQKQIESLQKEMGQQSANADALDKLEHELAKLREAARGLADNSNNASDAEKQKISDSLAALSRGAQAMGAQLPQLDEAIAALAANQTDAFVKDLDAAMTDLDKLRDMAKKMQQMQAQMEKLGKDLAEQLKYGQAEAAAATLKKMVDQLKSADLTPEQLQKMMEQVAQAVEPGSQYGKVGEYLKKAASQMQQGNKPDAAQSLAAAQKELEDLLNQLGDAKSLMATLDALKQASFCIGDGQCWGLNPSQRPGFNPNGGRPGGGVGTWGDDNASFDGQWTTHWDNTGLERPDMDPRGHTERDTTLSDALTPSKVKGQLSPGGPMPSITLKGVSIKGTSRVAYEEAASAAQADAQSALSQEKVPRAYQGAVRDYFDDLKK